jgi:hypothetical protein
LPTCPPISCGETNNHELLSGGCLFFFFLVLPVSVASFGKETFTRTVTVSKMLICDCGLLVKIRSGLGGFFFLPEQGAGAVYVPKGILFLESLATRYRIYTPFVGRKAYIVSRNGKSCSCVHLLVTWGGQTISSAILLLPRPRKLTNAGFHAYRYSTDTSVRHARKAPLEPILWEATHTPSV